jgi:hypothetical protein
MGQVYANRQTDMMKLTVDICKHSCDRACKRLDVLVLANKEQVYLLATFHCKIHLAYGGSYCHSYLNFTDVHT